MGSAESAERGPYGHVRFDAGTEWDWGERRSFPFTAHGISKEWLLPTLEREGVATLGVMLLRSKISEDVSDLTWAAVVRSEALGQGRSECDRRGTRHGD